VLTEIRFLFSFLPLEEGFLSLVLSVTYDDIVAGRAFTCASLGVFCPSSWTVPQAS